MGIRRQLLLNRWLQAAVEINWWWNQGALEREMIWGNNEDEEKEDGGVLIASITIRIILFVACCEMKWWWISESQTGRRPRLAGVGWWSLCPAQHDQWPRGDHHCPPGRCWWTWCLVPVQFPFSRRLIVNKSYFSTSPAKSIREERVTGRWAKQTKQMVFL